ncbi:MAG: hypothetical protein V7606_134 [Burkholderiales bacterium]
MAIMKNHRLPTRGHCNRIGAHIQGRPGSHYAITGKATGQPVGQQETQFPISAVLSHAPIGIAVTPDLS